MQKTSNFQRATSVIQLGLAIGSSHQMYFIEGKKLVMVLVTFYILQALYGGIGCEQG